MRRIKSLILSLSAVGLAITSWGQARWYYAGGADAGTDHRALFLALSPDQWLEGGEDYYSDAGSTPAVDGGDVQQWNDQSGNGYHATQTTAANCPHWREDLWFDHDGLDFDGSNDYMELNITPGTSATMFMVVSMRDGSGATYHAGGRDGSNQDKFWIFMDSDEMIKGTSGQQEVEGAVRGDIGSGNEATDWDVHHIMLWTDNSDIKLFVDGIEEASESTGTYGSGTGVENYLGDINSNGSPLGAPADCRVFEYAFWNSALSEADRSVAFIYADWKFFHRPADLDETPVLWLAAGQGRRVQTGATWYIDEWVCRQTGARIYDTGLNQYPQIGGFDSLWGYVQFDGSNDGLRGALDGGAVTQPFTVYMVVSQQGFTAGDVIMDGDDGTNTVILRQDDGGTAYDIEASAGTYHSTVLDPGDNDFHLVRLMFNGNSSEVELDGGGASVAAAGANVMDGITLGSTYDENNEANIHLHEVIVFDADVDDWNDYFGGKFSSLSLP